jgi:hypothetical protein
LILSWLVKPIFLESPQPTFIATTILWLLALRKEELDVSFARFLQVGGIAMPVALLLSLGGAILMQWLFPI